ncbi:MAG: Gfo/Idh/MocA family oxidoreductase, partial [Chthoniobacteraceae bacterium]
MAKKTLNIGLVGYGFMGRTHAHAYHNAAQFFDLPLTPVLKAVCGRDGAKAKAFADNWGATIVETDWKKLIANKEIDAIDIVTPNDSHAEIAMAAARADKMVLCEKPLALNGAQGAEMVRVIEEAGVPNTVWYNYRRVPAVTLA